ncbi:ARV1-like protein [Aulographum hederae CBS 113979]|uniref:Protein ARV n=1 Tax=Aulographum hederae CBS 113979 TaxID=1176131 RepID=A0A6G1H326_9PEZI|nr:ARV1-like protein [Aulographum hederae CBS 113979]
MICIECRYPVKSLYTTYSNSDDRVRLTQCPRCKRFADKYVEHDFVVLFIDLVLIKPQVYRHLLFNRLGREDDQFDPSILRLGTLLLLFDVYLTWARIEKSTPSATSPSSLGHAQLPHLLDTQPLVLQYFFFLLHCFLTTLAFHLPIRLLCNWTKDNRLCSLFPYYPHPNSLSTALFVSSCTKLFPMLLMVWEYDLPSSSSAVSWAVIVNNAAALEILMDCGYARATLLVAVGAALRGVVGWAILSSVGLKGGTGPDEGVERVGAWIIRAMEMGWGWIVGG